MLCFTLLYFFLLIKTEHAISGTSAATYKVMEPLWNFLKACITRWWKRHENESRKNVNTCLNWSLRWRFHNWKSGEIRKLLLKKTKFLDQAFFSHNSNVSIESWWETALVTRKSCSKRRTSKTSENCFAWRFRFRKVAGSDPLNCISQDCQLSNVLKTALNR